MLSTQPRLFGVPQHEMTSDDYYTPKWVFDALGLQFDLDVCAPPGGPPFVPAKRWFTMEDDGLAQPWEGRVWMNPPYSNCTPWSQRFVAHRHGIALTQMSKGAWCRHLFESCDGMVYAGSLRFIGGDIFMPVWFAAFGDECVDALRNIGPVRVVG